MTATIDQPTMTAAADQAPRRSSVLPVVHPAAWRGPLGEAVCRIAPATEADPIAILASALALFGAMAGPECYVRLGGVRHPPAIWPLVVGKTGSGRKGTSMAEAKVLARSWGDYAARYTRTRLPSGLSSGEGLLESLGADQGGGKGGDDPDREPTAPDGRLTVVETEFARVLTAAKRDGNTLGPVLRQLWDEGAAGVMTRARPLQVEGAHVGMIAHVTPRELRLKLAEADLAGGTVNRFLIIASERPHLLPHEPPRPDVTDLGEWIGRHLEHARSWGGEVRRDRHAEQLWPDVYGALSADEPDGIIGQVLARGPAYVMRLALGFALVDGSSTISKSHLLQGLAVWHYSTQSVRKLFADTQTSTDLRRLAEYIAAAGDDGRTRSDLYRLFGSNRSADHLAALIGQLEHAHQVTGEREETTGGRPAYRYRWAGRALDPVWQILCEHV